MPHIRHQLEEAILQKPTQLKFERVFIFIFTPTLLSRIEQEWRVV
jgi:hypothetical protein